MTKLIEFFGLIVMFTGGAAMDSPTIWVPIVMAFGGLGIFIGGCYLDDLKEGRS